MLKTDLIHHNAHRIDLPRWTITKRHQWMARELMGRRKTQADAQSRGLSLYQHLLSPFLHLSDRSVIFEVISDYLAGLEPIWRGLRVTRDDMYVLGGQEQDTFNEYVKDRRNQLSSLRFRTQLDIGAQLMEPSLFWITDDQVAYYHQGRWHALSQLPCPLIAKLKQRGQRDPGQIVYDIERSLITLQKDVLWPSFLPSDMTEKVSLVFIHASVWHVTGVWALHAGSEAHRRSKRRTDVGHILELVAPPALCLNDALGASFEQDRAHHRRFEDLHLYLKCQGYLNPERQLNGLSEQRLNDDARRVYERDLLPNRSERYKQVYELAIRKALDARPKLQPLKSEDPLTWLRRALEQTFVGWHLENPPKNGVESKEYQQPLIVELLIQDAVRLCSAVLRDLSNQPTIEFYGGQLQTALSALKEKFSHWLIFPERRPRVNRRDLARLLAATLLCVALVHKPRSKEWLSWCGEGFLVLLFSVQGTPGLPTRSHHTKWKEGRKKYEGEAAALARALKASGLKDEVIFYLLSLIRLGQNA
ncbi:MAG TPA: hypothetical protein VKA60_16415 [Blastocatellia bacterium]|nr:hypothetical protein [Blastocatellia bacterium]